MICEKCKWKIYLRGIGKGRCKECGKDVRTTHTPVHQLCPECAKKLNKCNQCSGDL